MTISPYLFFNGRCEEALEFYTQTLQAETLVKMHFSDSPQPLDPAMVPPGSEHMIMHATLKIGDTLLMVSDGHTTEPAKFAGFSLSFQPRDKQHAEQVFAGLSEGGTVRMPLGETFFSPCFGMVADKFGISWMIYLPMPM